MSDQEKRKPTDQENLKSTESSESTAGSEKKANTSGDASSDEKAAAAKAKAAAAAKAKARAAKKKEEAQEEEPQKPSPNQPQLDLYIRVLTRELGEEALEESYINRISKEMPTLVIYKEYWRDAAGLLKEHEELAFDYLSGLLGVDYKDRMDVVYHFYSYPHRRAVCVKVKTDRDEPQVPSVAPLWKGADWPEREAYDLLGIDFPGHPDLKRILLPDDWEGYPLRKDYEPLDEGV